MKGQSDESIRCPGPGGRPRGWAIVRRLSGIGVLGLGLALTGCWEEPPRLLEEGDPLASAEAWLEFYPEVESHPYLVRAREVFERVRQTVGVHADLEVLEMGRIPRALALPDETVLLSESGLDLCYEGLPVETGDARLAFLLGHELVHVARNDFWHASAFQAVQGVEAEDETMLRLRELLAQDGRDRQVLELHADHAGILAALQAGYDVAPLLHGEQSFFEEWTGGPDGSLAYADPDHPDPAARASFLQRRLAEVAVEIDRFDQGVQAFREAEALAAPGNGREILPQVEAKYQEAIRHFDVFRRAFDGREVLSNLALAHLRLATAELARCDGMLVNRYYLPTVLDPVTLAERTRNRGSGEYSSHCFENDEYQRHMREAIRLLEEAVARDPRYLPARLNLVAAFVVDEKDANAALQGHEAVRIAPDDPDALNSRAVAHLLAVELGNRWVDEDMPVTELMELHRRFPDDSAIAFNLASGLSYQGRLEEARPVWRDFLALEPEGPWALIAREWVGDEGVAAARVARR